MIGIRLMIAISGLCIFCGWHSPVLAEGTPGSDNRYADEQALITRLSASSVPEDQRHLAELLRDGPVIRADNPLRRSDRDGAILAYRRAIALGDPSAGTVVALSRLLLRQSDSQGLADMRPALRNLMLQGNGDAAYVLALDAAQNLKLPEKETTARLEAAAIMGSIPAVMDLAGSSQKIGETVRAAALDALQQRANGGWAPASYALYQAYKDGQLVKPSPVTAMKWLRLAAEQSHVTAIERLADHFRRGLDVEADPAEAARLYRKAAEAGSGTAAMTIGRSVGSGPGMGFPMEEGRLWLTRAAETGLRGAAAELSGIELGLALASGAGPADMAVKIEAALAPIAQDPEALASLANRHWKTANSKSIGPALLPLLKAQALQGSPTAGLAYNAWLQANGEALPNEVAEALVAGLQKRPLGSVAFSNFTIADLTLEGRIPEQVLPRQAALRLLVEAADEKVGQAMLRLGQLYMRGDQLAHSTAFARRWLLEAKAQAVERASWDLAVLQLADGDEAERAEGERFYLDQLDNGDVRAALALVQYGLQTGRLDTPTLAQAKRATREPHDVVQLAAMLISSGIGRHIEAGNQLLAALPEDQLDPETLIAYGRLLIMTASSDADGEHGIRLLAKAAETGDASAKVALASTYLSSVTHGDKQKYALRLLGDVLEDNPHDPDAQLLMSRAYLMGLGVKRDAQQAAGLIASIRAQGEYRNPKATMLAADWLAFSASGRNPTAAVTLLKAQAARGSIAADRALGDTYLSGFGPSLEPDMAASRLYKAANGGDKEAMASLGHLLVNGYGVSQSREEGLAWLARAAEAGNTAAMYELSRIFALAPAGGQSDEIQALYWLKRAANRNHPNASYQLGLAYLKGEWVTADVDEAALWFERSAGSGNLLAARTLDVLRRQIAEGAAADITEVSHE